MSEDSPEAQAERLRRLSEEVTRIAGSLAQLSMGLTAPVQHNYPATNSNDPEVSTHAVSWLIRARRDRARYLSPNLFAEPAWDMLLDLLHAELAYRRVSVSSVCLAGGLAATTGLRWLKTLEREGLVVRRVDPHDARRTFVELSPDTSKALRSYFVDVVEVRRAEEH